MSDLLISVGTLVALATFTVVLLLILRRSSNPSVQDLSWPSMRAEILSVQESGGSYNGIPNIYFDIRIEPDDRPHYAVRRVKKNMPVLHAAHYFPPGTRVRIRVHPDKPHKVGRMVLEDEEMASRIPPA